MDRSRTSALSRVLRERHAGGARCLRWRCRHRPESRSARAARPPPIPVRRRRRPTCRRSRSTSGTTSRRPTAADSVTSRRGQTPQFVRQDDVNLAYEAANTVVTLSSPQDSQHGHEGRRRSQLLAREQRGLRRHPDDLDLELGRRHRRRRRRRRARGAAAARTRARARASRRIRRSSRAPSIRSSSSTASAATRRRRPIAQSPYFASEDIAEAYGAARTKINLDQPALSRLVVRLRNEFHNCWSDCAANANTMQAAIQAFANQVPLTQVDASLVLSKALSLYDGTVASGGNRYNGNVDRHVGVQDGLRHGCVRHQRRRARDRPHAVGRRHLGRRLGHQRPERQGAGLDHEQQEAPRPDQGHR